MEYDKKIENYINFMDYIRKNGYLTDINYSKFTITYKYEEVTVTKESMLVRSIYGGSVYKAASNLDLWHC